MIKTREGFWVVAALAIAAGACKKGKAGGPDPAGGGPGGGGPMGMPVEVVVARTDTVRDEIAATGQIEAVQSIDLRPEVDGRIVEILIREGQEVEQETPLFRWTTPSCRRRSPSSRPSGTSPGRPWRAPRTWRSRTPRP